MKLAIVGSRTFTKGNILSYYANILLCPLEQEQVTIISGGAKGADSLARRFAQASEFEYVEFLPDWKNEGRVAGFNRNAKIVEACDMVLAFWDGISRGTKDTIKKAKRAKKPTLIIYF